jgi:hypothetical protein
VTGPRLACSAAVELPHTDFVELAWHIFTAARMRHMHAYWASSTQPGGIVRSYADPTYGGTISDVPSDHLLQIVQAGRQVFASRDAVADLMRPDAPDVIERRSRLLSRAVVNEARPCADYLALVRAAVTSPPDSGDDHYFVQQAQALCVYPVRDAVIGMCLGDDADWAEQLWLTLVRGLPAPERAEPAVLIAFAAMLRGDGARANIALEIVEQATPLHWLGSWLHGAQRLHVPREEIRAFVRAIATDAVADIEREQVPRTNENHVAHLH